MLKSFLALTLLIANASSSFAMGDPGPSVNQGQRYITISTYWSDMNKADRQAVVNEAVTQVLNEIAEKGPQLKLSPTLEKSLLSKVFVDQLQTELRRYLDGVSAIQRSKYSLVRKSDMLLPRAILITIGGSGSFHWTFGGAVSMDLGVVLMFPSFRTVIDTAHRDAQNRPLVIEGDKFHLFDASVVGVPHAYAGVGYKAGGTFSVGVSGIWGHMSSAEDFHGVFLAGSAGAQIPVTAIAAIPVVGWMLAPFLALFPDGADIDVQAVGNMDHAFFVVKLSADKGAEAGVSVDGEAGAIVPWTDLMSKLKGMTPSIFK